MIKSNWDKLYKYKHRSYQEKYAWRQVDSIMNYLWKYYEKQNKL